MMEIHEIDWKRIFWCLLSIALAITASIYGQPLLQNNESAINTIVTVFSILAGFLVAITSIMGDPSLLLPGSWRIAEIQRAEIRKKLMRQQFLFHLYLLTLFMIFLSQIIDSQFCIIKNNICLARLIEHCYLFFAALGLIISFRLPHTLSIIQQERIDAVIEARKAKKSRDV